MSQEKERDVISHEIVPAVHLVNSAYRKKFGWMVIYKGTSLFFMEENTLNDLKKRFPQAYNIATLEISDMEFDNREAIENYQESKDIPFWKAI